MEEEITITDHSSGHQDKQEWDYAMRRDMQEIVPGLFLGPYASAMKSKLDHLLAIGITHIICIRQAVEANFVRPNFPDRFKYLILDIADSPTQNIIRFFKQAYDFIDSSLSSGGKVLVHGNGGISRSAAVVTAYVMAKFSLTCSEAMYCVQSRRFCVSVNEGFHHQLIEYEHIYKAEFMNKAQPLTHQGVTPVSSGPPSRKRKEMDYDVSPSDGWSNMQADS